MTTTHERQTELGSTVDRVLAGGGDAGALARAVDWSRTALGPVESWSPALRSTAALVLHNHWCLLLWWGLELIQIYNDACRPVLGDKHPRAMGQAVRDCWTEVFDILGPLAEGPLRGGPASVSDDLLLPLDRKLPREEAHFRVAYSAVPDDTVADTRIGGVLAVVTEITEQVYADRQLRTLEALGQRGAALGTVEQACAAAAAALATDAWDVPFAALYLLDAGGTRASRAAGGGGALPPDVEAALVTRVGRTQVVEVLDAPSLAAVARSPWGDPASVLIALPLAAPEQASAFGVLLCGVSPHRRLDHGYRAFFERCAAHVAAAIRDARALAEERQTIADLRSSAREVERSKLRALIEDAPAIIATMRGPDHVFELANARYAQIVGQRPVIGLPISRALPELAGQGYIELLDEVYRTGVPRTRNESRVMIDSSGTGLLDEVFVNFVFHPSRDAAGAVDGVLVFAFDVTEHVRSRRRAEREGRTAASARARAESEGRTRDEFLTIASHEIRTPLTTLGLQLDGLLQGMRGEPLALERGWLRKAERVRDQADRLEALVEGMMDVFELGRDPVDLELADVDLADVARRVVARSPGVELSALSMVGRWDARRLEQIVEHLLANALKFGAGKRIDVVVEGDRERARLRVVDRGIGIAAEHHQRIFGRFERATSATNYGGFGLGLWVVRELVRAMGGTVRVESEVGHGSTFVVELPRSA